MPHPYVDSSYVLATSQNLIREMYAPDVHDHSFRFGPMTLRLFKPMDTLVTGDGITIQGFAGLSDSSRASRDPNRDFLRQNKLRSEKFKIRFSDTDPSNNDMNELQGVAQISDIELVTSASRSPEAVAVDVAEKVIRDLRDSIDHSKAVLMHATAGGRVALVNGGKKNNDSTSYAEASSYTSGSTSFRCQIDGGSIAHFQPGMVFDFYTAGGAMTADSYVCTDANTEDLSAGFRATEKSTVANADLVGDDDEIFRDGERGGGFRGSLQATFTNPVPGESWLGGIDRSKVENRWLVPKISRAGAAPATVNKSHLNSHGLAMSLAIPPDVDGGVVALGHPSIIQALRDSVGEEAMRTEDAANRSGTYSFGSSVLYFIHPYFGKLSLMEDPLCVPGVLYFIVPKTWKMAYYGWQGFRFVGGESGGMWRYMNSATPGGGVSKFLTAQGYQILTPVCDMPIVNGCILNLAA